MEFIDATIEEIDEIMQKSWRAFHIYRKGSLKQRAGFMRAIAKELEEKYARKKSNGSNVAGAYVGLGEKDKAFEWLEKDFQTRDGYLVTIRWTIPFEPLRDDPRFKDLLIRMGLPE